ncbi:MAG TPA: helix-turn-helix domain-containing protein [Rubrobacter sp.]|nr:helix-turn-helix domain-containing protein [Rubrobacter sp.]
MDGEMHSETSTQHPGEAVGERGEDLAGSGWTTTKQAAKVLGVSRRSVQGYVRQGILEARDEGEGVNKRFLVSIDSLNALSARRKREAGVRANFAEPSAGLEERAKLAANTDEGLRHLIARLEARTEEATELRIRLELTEKAQSTLEDDLAEERRLREEAEREREDLRRKLEALREPPQGAGTLEEAPERAQPQSAAGEAQEAAQRPWWRRVFGS